MLEKSENKKRLTGSQLGYRGKGTPDPETINALQLEYCNALVAGGLPAEIRCKLERMRALTAVALHGEENNVRESEIASAFEEIVTISSELAPILNFDVDDVDWNG